MTTQPDPTPTAETLDLTAAAQWLLVIHADPTLRKTASWTAVLGLWEQLTGIDGEDAAVRYARTVRDTPTLAYLRPF